jgi:hypothetical protein
MSDQYIVSGKLDGQPIAAEPFPTEQEALQKAKRPRAEHGDHIELQICLNHVSAVLYNDQWLKRHEV